MCSFTAGRNGWLKGGHIGTASKVLYWRLGKWFGDPVGVTAPEPGPAVLERTARLESVWGYYRSRCAPSRQGGMGGSRVRIIVSLASSLYSQHNSATSGSPTKLASHRRFGTHQSAQNTAAMPETKIITHS